MTEEQVWAGFVADSRNERTKPRLVQYHRGGVPWHEAPNPRRLHRCQVQTYGWLGFTQVFRCACGAISDDAKRWAKKNRG